MIRVVFSTTVCALAAWIAASVPSASYAGNVTIIDGDTIKLDGTRYRLDGIDAPEPDQVCLTERGAPWPCGIYGRARLSDYIGSRSVTCQDKGADTAFPERHIGLCTVEGETTSISSFLVHEGLAINFEPYAKGRFAQEQDSARQNQRGLWKGCFTAPQDLRYWRKGSATLLGSHCPAEKVARNALFPDHPEKPPDCAIKGKLALRAKITGHCGIYHLEGCRSYRTVKRPERWFCSEEEARAAGFRKAFTCP
jgi:endonuclease YncB( thermonuclease family)